MLLSCFLHPSLMDSLSVTVGPITISLAVPFRIVTPLNRKGRIGFRTHIFQELNKTFAPLRTDSDTSSAIKPIVFPVFVVTASFDIPPTNVFGSWPRRCLSSVFRVAPSNQNRSKAPARLHAIDVAFIENLVCATSCAINSALVIWQKRLHIERTEYSV